MNKTQMLVKYSGKKLNHDFQDELLRDINSLPDADPETIEVVRNKYLALIEGIKKEQQEPITYSPPKEVSVQEPTTLYGDEIKPEEPASFFSGLLTGFIIGGTSMAIVMYILR